MKKDALAILLLLVLECMLYFMTLRGIPGNVEPEDLQGVLSFPGQPFELPAERSRFVHTMALAEQHTYALDARLGEALGPQVREEDGKHYGLYANGIAFFAVPLYSVGKYFQVSQVLAFSVAALFGIAAALMLYLVARNIFGMPLPFALFSVLVFSFGTPAWNYATTLYPYTATVFFLLAAFYAAWRYQQRSSPWLWAGVVWLSFGMVIWVDPQASLLILPILIYFFRNSFSSEASGGGIHSTVDLRGLVTGLLFFGLVAGGLHFWPDAAFVVTRTGEEIADYRYPTVERFSHKPRIEPGATIATTSHEPPKLWHEDNLPGGFLPFFFSVSRGWFVYAPVLLFGFLGIAAAFRRSVTKEHWTLIGIVLINLFLSVSFSNPVGGWSYGPKLLIPAGAILALFGGIFLVSIARNFWRRLIVWIAFLFSAGVALLGSLTTNAIPPAAETGSIGLSYNFLRSVNFLLSGQSSSFFFNFLLPAGYVTLVEFFLILFSLLAILSLIILFWLPHTRYASPSHIQ